MLDHCGLQTNPSRSDSFALTLYRTCPKDHYPYLIAAAGLREPEPMFGPYNDNDFRGSPDRKTYQHHPLGFRAREGTVEVKEVRQDTWQLYINSRTKGMMTPRRGDQIERLTANLGSLLRIPPDNSHPLYPDLWYQERIGRDRLRDRVHRLPPGTSLETVAAIVSEALAIQFPAWTQPATDIGVAIYLKTAIGWQLCGTPPILFPREVPATIGRSLHAFDWVASSGRAVLVRRDSKAWLDRLTSCGPEFRNIVDQGSFAGVCVSPLLNPQQGDCIGVILLLAQTPASPVTGMLLPAHVYLLSRLSMTASGYLVPLLIPGFRWMPQAKLDRGGATVETGDWSSGHIPPEVVRSVVSDLMPTESRVRITALRAGHSDSEAFRLDVSDKNRLPEIPRVLKVGSEALAEDELTRYYRYAHNKRVGGAARVDIARGFVWPRTHDHKRYGAIIYTFVGAGGRADPWSEWAPKAMTDQIALGFAILLDQLSGWFRMVPVPDRCAVDLMITPLLERSGGLQNYLAPGIKLSPSFDEVRNALTEIVSVDWRGARGCDTCIVHGDLHSDNLFAILERTEGAGTDKRVGAIRDVALIDWGNVRSGRHPLSDVSKLVTDLVYRVRPDLTKRAAINKQPNIWGRALGCDDNDWKVAMIHHIAKILFYKYGADDKKPYISDEARAEAWSDLKQLSQEIIDARTTGQGKRMSASQPRTKPVLKALANNKTLDRSDKSKRSIPRSSPKSRE
jgi:hypothetical protein